MAQLTQVELPLVKVAGQPVETLPEDLYIPPEALEVFMDAFEGPLDFLLYLIRRQNIDILQVDVARLTEQYVAYVDAMRLLKLELAADYLVMAALLAEIKSRALLPVQAADDDDEVDDPKSELLRRLQAYEEIQKGAEHIRARPELGRDFFAAQIQAPEAAPRPVADVPLAELLSAMADVMRRVSFKESHQVKYEPLSTRARMGDLLERIVPGQFVSFTDLLLQAESKAGVVVTFLATLELVKEGLINIVQTELYGTIQLGLRDGTA